MDEGSSTSRPPLKSEKQKREPIPIVDTGVTTRALKQNQSVNE